MESPAAALNGQCTISAVKCLKDLHRKTPDYTQELARTYAFMGSNHWDEDKQKAQAVIEEFMDRQLADAGQSPSETSMSASQKAIEPGKNDEQVPIEKL